MPAAFSADHLRALEQHGISLVEAERQLAQLRHGQAYLEIARPCTTGDGILQLNENDSIELCRTFSNSRQRFTRFVPASGAASRMFQGLFPAELDSEKAVKLRENLDRFPFHADLADHTTSAPKDLDDQSLFSLLLSEEGLGLAGKPKGLLPLHRGENYNRTAFEEHLCESHRIGISRFHFTVSPDHLELFRQKLALVEKVLGTDALDVDFSLQSPQTDTISLDRQNNEPFTDEQGDLLFRPAGHGALLSNLEACRGDLVLIRNIDNVVPQHLQEPYQFWTEVLGGLLLKTQDQVFSLIEKLETNPTEATLLEAGDFLRMNFGRPTTAGSTSTEKLIALLDRPIRICGMVPVSGQPGGGPFWAPDGLGQVSPQVVEGVQVNPDNSAQQTIMADSTHFNPVNIACSLRNHHGQPYLLDDFIDQKAAIITAKNHAGRNLLALERPGLWNGAMSGWNTLFIELPAATFNPVKTVFDLLQPAHQPNGN